MAAEAKPRWTAAEYLRQERGAATRSEFYRGEIFAMAGASREHNILVAALAALLYPQLLGRGCELYASDMRVRVPATDLFTYPDLAAVCGEPSFDDRELDTLLNPTFLVEVFSPSTADYDRGRKFAHYRTLPSLAGYLLVDQERVHVEYFSREPDGRWLLSETRDRDAVVELDALGCRLSVGELYARMPPGWG